MGTHVVPPGPVAAVVGPVAGAPSTPLVRLAAKTSSIPEQQAKKLAVKVAPVRRLMKKGSLVAFNEAVAAAPGAGGEHAHEVFVEMPAEIVLRQVVVEPAVMLDLASE
jgi:hypothetical protein